MRAQIKMTETIAVLIIFFFLLVFAISFFSGEEKRSTEKKISEFQELDAVKIAQIASFMPELQCSKSANKNCVDLYKARAFSSFKEKNKEYYYDFFKNAKIVLEYYPIVSESLTHKNLTLYENYPNYTNYDISPFKVPVSVINVSKNTNYFGVLTIEKYY